MTERRRRFNLIAFAEEARGKAKLVVGAERDELLKKARRADTAAHIDDWLNSPELHRRSDDFSSGGFAGDEHHGNDADLAQPQPVPGPISR